MNSEFTSAFEHHQAGRLAEAEKACRVSLSLNPLHTESLNLLGIIACERGEYKIGIDLISEALKADYVNPSYHYNLGIALFLDGRLLDSVNSLENAVDLCQDYPGAVDNIVSICHKIGKESVERGFFTDAIKILNKAVFYGPRNKEILILLATALHLNGFLDDALRKYEILTKNFGYDHFVLNNIGIILKDKGDFAGALEAFDRAIRLKTDFADAHLNQSMLRLSVGDFRDGWDQFEWRWQTSQFSGYDRRLGVPCWDGSDGNGRQMLVWAEQGFGDSLQFCRYVPMLVRRGWNVTLAVPKALVRLLRSLDDKIEVVMNETPVKTIDCHCPMMSLPRLFCTMLDTIPADMPYLAADTAEVARWRARLAAAGLRPGHLAIGLVWAGNPIIHSPLMEMTNARRSIALDRLAPLFPLPGMRFVSLQKERRPDDDPAAHGLVDVMEEVRDFADTAAIIANLDLVISVDTAITHLAGALGKPVWLLNRFDTCWRWLRDRSDSPWYPTLRQFRQVKAGDWSSVLIEVEKALLRFNRK